MDDKLYDTVGIECGEADGQEVVGLMFPTGPTVIAGMEVASHDCEVRYLTLPAAKALLIDLRDAIQVCVDHRGGPVP